MSDLALTNLRDLTHRYFEQERVVSLRRHLSGASAAERRQLLRFHSEPVLDPKEIAYRDTTDELLAFYSRVAVASLVRLVPDPLPPKFAEMALRDLAMPELASYYEQHYPLLLPQLLRRRLEDTEFRPADEDAASAWTLYAQFLDVNSSIESDASVEAFLWFLDDGFTEGFGLEDLLKTIEQPRQFFRRMSRVEPEDALDLALRGFGEFMIFCMELDALLVRTARWPLLQSGMWHHHGYWFDFLGEKVGRELNEALDSFMRWHEIAPDSIDAPEMVMPSIEDARQSLQRLTGTEYGQALRGLMEEMPA